MAIYDRDRNGTLRHDRDAAELLAKAARRAGYDLPFRTLPLGASDAAGFTQAGLRAIALIAMDPTPQRWYHTRLDTPDLLRPECLEAALKVMLELIRTVDAEGLCTSS
ncbi:MAG: M28 family peptidase [Deltaproteobacteria bacterium]|nr:M28 family peptidase [Deltaproteobacteria bacterium]MBW2362062.1 M28 family peptidase [Deltaproteobacteria bacterium]